MTNTPKPATSAAFYVQSQISFLVALSAVTMGVYYLPVDAWMRAFLAIGLLYVVTASFTLAKCVRDRQEETSVVSRLDQARLDRLLAEHDPFRTDAA